MNIRCVIFSLLMVVPSLWAQQGRTGGIALDVQQYQIKAEVVPDRSFLEGEVKIQFIALEDNLSLPFELNSRMTLLEVFDEEDNLYSLDYGDFQSDSLRVRGNEPFRAQTEYTLIFRWEGNLEKNNPHPQEPLWLVHLPDPPWGHAYPCAGRRQ